jgi:Cu+-exporting ATPase
MCCCAPKETESKMTDPVCRMTVDPAKAAGTSEYKGLTYAFCSAGCKRKFDAEPDRYLEQESSCCSPATLSSVETGTATAAASCCAPAPQASSNVVDPVCGMSIDSAKAAGSSAHAGTTYFFCSKGCLAKFEGDPAKYLTPKMPETQPSKADRAVEYICPMDPEVSQMGPGSCPKCGMALEPAVQIASPQRTEYTCPMHPEIVRPEPGNCPICGIALEPREITAAKEVNPELADMSRRLWITIALALPLLALMVSDLLPSIPLQHLLTAHTWAGIEFALATPVVLWCGWPFFVRGWQSLVNRSLNMFTLIALGTGAAYLYSVVATFVPQLFPSSFRAEGGEIALYYEPAVVIIALVLLGQVMELLRAGDGAACSQPDRKRDSCAFRLNSQNC